MIRTLACVLAVVPLLFACKSESSAKPKPTTKDTVVELASVTLADDCGDSALPPPPPAAAAAPAKVAPPASPPVAPADEAAAPAAIAARCVGPDCANNLRRACDQTSMQLALTAGAATTVTVKKVELLDAAGALVGELTARKATVWSDAAGAYQPWDQQLAAGAKVNVSYALSAPDWGKVEGGRWEAHTKQFQLRVTLTVGTANRTIEKKAISPAMIPPAVPT